MAIELFVGILTNGIHTGHNPLDKIRNPDSVRGDCARIPAKSPRCSSVCSALPDHLASLVVDRTVEEFNDQANDTCQVMYLIFSE